MEPGITNTLGYLKAEISRTRKDILDTLELAFREHPNWQFVRTRVLRSLGKSGLEGALDRASKQTKSISRSD